MGFPRLRPSILLLTFAAAILLCASPEAEPGEKKTDPADAQVGKYGDHSHAKSGNPKKGESSDKDDCLIKDAKDAKTSKGATRTGASDLSSGKAITGNTQVSNYSNAGSDLDSGRGQSLDRAAKAEEASEADRDQARLERRASEQIRENQRQIESFVRPLQASTNPSDRAKANQFLAQSSTPPEKLQPVYEALDLNTNQDVLERGPKISQNLEKTSEDWQKASDEWKSEADKARSAADQMAKMESTVARSGQNMGTITQDPSGAAHPSTSAAQDSKLSAGSVGSGADVKLGGPNANQAASNAASGTNAGGKGATAATVGLAQATGSTSTQGSGANTLRDQLRGRLLASQSTKGAGAAVTATSETPPKSAFDSLFEHHAGSTISQEEAAADAVTRARNFSMSGSDTDAAVKKLVSKIAGDEETKGSEERLFGNPAVTIFARMSKYLTRAQADKKVAR